MNARTAEGRMEDQRGFILATVLVFIVVLSITAFLAAKLTRTDIQVVNNLQNEKEALSIAEAGIQEALYRMSVAKGHTSTVNGQTFDASLVPSVPDRTLSSPFYGIDYTNTQSTSQVIFTTNAPATGTNKVVPSLQPTSLRLPYTFATADSAPVNLSTTANLTVGWDICANGTDPGCSAAGAIRTLPLSSPRYVTKIVSTGRAGTATRKITAQAVDCIPASTPGDGSLVSLDQSCPANPAAPGGINFNGTNDLTTSGVIQVNAGFGSASCSNAIRSGGSQSSMSGSQINTSGGVSGNGSMTPAPITGGLPQGDPYRDMRPPCYPGGQATCQGTPLTATDVRSGTATNPVKYQCTSCTSLQPGIYYGGIDVSAPSVTMATGYYIIAGGGFSIGNGSVVQSAAGGVMIFNTLNTANGCHPSSLCNGGSFSLTNGTTNPSFVGISNQNDPFFGVVFFQDRAPTNTGPYPGTLPLNQPTLNIQGGSSGRALDGLVYAPDAVLNVTGTNTVPLGGALIVKSASFAGGSGLNIQNSSNGLPETECGGLAYQIIGWQDF